MVFLESLFNVINRLFLDFDYVNIEICSCDIFGKIFKFKVL